MTRNATAVIFIVLTIASTASAANQWEKDGTKGGVTVFTRLEPDSGVPRVKAVTTLDATTQEVWEYLDSEDSKSDALKASKKLDTCGPNCVYLYQKFGNPFISYWDYVIKVKWDSSEVDGLTTYRRTWKKTDKKSLPDSGATEVAQISGSWTLEPIDGGKRTRVIYTNHVDLGSSIPLKIYNPCFVSSAYKALRELRKAF